MNTDSFSLSYQPIWSTRQKKYVAADTMMELTDEQYGTLDMTVIMGTAEKKGLSIRLGNYLMERVFMDIREKKLAEYEYVHVPLSTVQCMQLDFTDKVWKLREKYGIHPEQVCFSFKESVYENISEVLNENLNRLSAQGYRLMLDGFGKGCGIYFIINEIL